MSNTPGYRTEAELKASIDEMRAQLTESLAELSHEATPQVQMAKAKDSAKRKAEDIKQQATDTVKGVLHGDTDAMLRAAAVLGIGAAAVTLVVLRGKQRKHRRAEVQQWRRLVRQMGRLTPPTGLTLTVE